MTEPVSLLYIFCSICVIGLAIGTALAIIGFCIWTGLESADLFFTWLKRKASGEKPKRSIYKDRDLRIL